MFKLKVNINCPCENSRKRKRSHQLTVFSLLYKASLVTKIFAVLFILVPITVPTNCAMLGFHLLCHLALHELFNPKYQAYVNASHCLHICILRFADVTLEFLHLNEGSRLKTCWKAVYSCVN